MAPKSRGPRFGEATILDVIATAGYFGFVSLILNAIRHPVPEHGVQLPERAGR